MATFITSQIIIAFIAGWLILNIVGDWLLFKKAGKPGWHSLIPILNIWDEYDICWSGSMGMAAFVLMVAAQSANSSSNNIIAFCGLAAGIAYLVIHFKESMKLARAFGKGTGYGLILFFFDRIGRVILGLGSAKYIGKEI